MSLENRAAQFAPFSALSGHDEAINETARQTMQKKILSEEEQVELSRKLTLLLERMDNRHPTKFVYFNPDPLKEGGEYLEITSLIRKFDEYQKALLLENGMWLELDNLISIETQL